MESARFALHQRRSVCFARVTDCLHLITLENGFRVRAASLYNVVFPMFFYPRFFSPLKMMSDRCSQN